VKSTVEHLNGEEELDSLQDNYYLSVQNEGMPQLFSQFESSRLSFVSKYTRMEVRKLLCAGHIQITGLCKNIYILLLDN
jgi:hypothetical protein